MNTHLTIDPVLTSEAARICAVSPETIRQWERHGKLSAVKIGRGVRLFERRDCERIAREREARRAAAAASAPVVA